MTDIDLITAARFEVESRERHYPALVASRKMTAEEANNDFQAWHCILAWLERGRSPAGMVDGKTGRPDEAQLPLIVVEWLLCEQAADRAVVSTSQAQTTAAESGDQAKADRLGVRLDGLRMIARKVGSQRRMIEDLNRALRERRDRERQQEPQQQSGQPDAEEFRRKHGNGRKAA